MGWRKAVILLSATCLNEFYVVGPADDPARVRSAATAVDAFRRIAAAQARFLPRGDQSGTHQRELAIWRQTGIVPKGDWYATSGDFMLPSLSRADATRAYFLTDSSSWVTARAELRHLAGLLQSDRALRQPVRSRIAMHPGLPPPRQIQRRG